MGIESYGGRAIFSGDVVFLTAHTGKMLHVEGVDVQALWHDHGDWQKFIIRKDGSGVILPGDLIFLQAHTGTYLEIEGDTVQARWPERGLWQGLVIEKVISSRRLKVQPGSDHYVHSMASMSATVLSITTILVALASASMAVFLKRRSGISKQEVLCKLHPVERDEDPTQGEQI